jgi:hypothetical protein
MYPPSIIKKKRYTRRKNNENQELDIQKRYASAGPNK